MQNRDPTANMREALRDDLNEQESLVLNPLERMQRLN